MSDELNASETVSRPLDELRQEIDALDAAILDLLSDRARVVQEVGRTKSRTAAQYFAPERERRIFDRLDSLNKGPLGNMAIHAIYREIISASRALEIPLAIAYLGPPGTFSHQAALKKFGASTEPKPVDTIPDVFAAVERGDAHYGVVPVENSTEGVVPYTLDMFSQTRLKICAEVFVPIHHHLATRASSLKEIRRIYAHPQSSAQSRTYLRENFPKIEIVEVSSNSKSAQMAALDSEGAAICTDIAAEIYGIPIIARHIEDSAHNRTRFLVIGENEPQLSGKDKTSIVFSVPSVAGALLRAMVAFDAYGINLTMIESRPTKENPWEYNFFIDFQAHVKEDHAARALKMLAERATYVTVLGSYPEAE